MALAIASSHHSARSGPGASTLSAPAVNDR
jgi:hypothetical protein